MQRWHLRKVALAHRTRLYLIITAFAVLTALFAAAVRSYAGLKRSPAMDIQEVRKTSG
jgi:chorismate mutase